MSASPQPLTSQAPPQQSSSPKWAVQAPDGKVIQFPDNFTDQDVSREMTKMYPPNPEAQAAANPPKANSYPRMFQTGLTGEQTVPLTREQSNRGNTGAASGVLGGMGALAPIAGIPKLGLTPWLASAARGVAKALGASYLGEKAGGYAGGLISPEASEAGKTIGKYTGLGAGPLALSDTSLAKLPFGSSLFSDEELAAQSANSRLAQRTANIKAGLQQPPDPVAQAVRGRTASWLPTKVPIPQEEPEVDPVAQAVKSRTASWIPTRVKPTVAPQGNSLTQTLMGQGMSTSPESVQQIPKTNLPFLSSEQETSPTTATGPQAKIVSRNYKPPKSLIVDPNSPAPHVEGSYWSFPEPSLRQTVLSGDRDAAIVYKQRFGNLPPGAKYLTDVGNVPNKGLYESRK